MIGYFPEPYPNELFYSVCARYASRTAIPTVTGVMRSLFGRRHAVAVVDLPNHLEALVSNLPIGTNLSVDAIVQQHTLFPAFQPFIDSRDCEEIRQFMSNSQNANIRTRCGVCSNRVRPPSHFKTCLACDRENRERYYETYWNRLFQITGVEVCPVHRIFLASTDICFQPLANRHHFVAADAAKSDGSIKTLDRENQQHKVLLQIATDVAWILRQPRLNPGLNFIHERYVSLLRNRSVVTAGGSVRMAELKKQFLEHFTPDLLNLLQSSVSEADSRSWLEKMVRPSRNAAAPLRHMLMMNFLGITSEQFFSPSLDANGPRTDQDFRGPHPCFNPVCDFFNKPIIQTHRVEYQRKKNCNIAIFLCTHCGFEFAGQLADQSMLKPSYIREFGVKWKDRLSELWRDQALTLRQMSSVLGVDPKTVKQHAYSLGLAFPRPGSRPVTKKGIYRRLSVDKEKIKTQKRDSWVDLQNKNPKLGVKALRALQPAIFAWLYANDRQWLRRNQPARSQTPRKDRFLVDWAKRDEYMATQIANAAYRLKNRQGRTVRVTATAIGREMGKQSLLENHYRKLPLTCAMIKSFVESGEQYAARRIYHAGEKLIRLGMPFEKWQLLRAAGVGMQHTGEKIVNDALEYELVRAKHQNSVRNRI